MDKTQYSSEFLNQFPASYRGALGCDAAPANKLEASELIERYKAKKRQPSPPLAVTAQRNALTPLESNDA